LLVGLGVASATNGLLALSVDTKQIPQEVVVPVSAPTQPAEPPDIATIAMPKGYADDPLLAMAVERFQDALATVGERPKIVSGSADFVVRQKDLPAQGFQMWAEGVNGAGRQGMANGLLAAADSVAAGQELPASPGAPVVPQLEYRFADYGAVGVQPDPAGVGSAGRLLAQLPAVRRRRVRRGAVDRPRRAGERHPTGRTTSTTSAPTATTVSSSAASWST
jgi:hypothetical protein